MAPLRVLISGAGIAGNALAFWLSKLGHHVTIVEYHPELRATGLQIDLRGHGIEVLNRMGLDGAFRAKSVPEQGLQIVDQRDRRWAYFAANKSGKGMQSFTSDYEIMRGDLCHVFYHTTKSRTRYIFGTSIESFAQRGDVVDVSFTDGQCETFDLVVGADGQQSRTRKMMLGHSGDDSFHPLSGDHIAYFISPKPIQQDEQYIASLYMAPGRRNVMTRRHSPEYVQVYLICNSLSPSLVQAHRGDVQAEKRALAEIFTGAGWKTEEMISLMYESKDFYLERQGFVKLPSWSQGRITLVGDAAYCPSGNTGMGVTSSIVGAYILAGEIGKHCGRGDKNGDSTRANAKGDLDAEGDLEAALASFEQKFRPFIDQVQNGLGEESTFWGIVISTRFGIVMLYWLMAIVSFLRLDVVSEWFIKENIKDWDLPNYEELL